MKATERDGKVERIGRDLKPQDAKGLRVSLPAVEFYINDPPLYITVWVYVSRRPADAPTRKLMIKRFKPSQ